MKFVLTFLILPFFLACTKQKDNPSEKDTASITGTWKMSELRADPGDGSGRFLPSPFTATISFSASGQYTDSRDGLYDRFEMVATDTVRLYHSSQQRNKLLAIQELSGSALTYYCNWPWCGGPYGEKFVRIRENKD